MRAGTVWFVALTWNSQWAAAMDMGYMAESDFPAYMRVPTDGNGKTQIRGLKPGKYTLKVDGSKATAEATVVEEQTTEVKIGL